MRPLVISKRDVLHQHVYTGSVAFKGKDWSVENLQICSALQALPQGLLLPQQAAFKAQRFASTVICLAALFRMHPASHVLISLSLFVGYKHWIWAVKTCDL